MSPPIRACYFIRGNLRCEEINYPLWVESKFYLNDQLLDEKPISWGHISDDEQLFYVYDHGSERLKSNSGFIGLYVDDFLGEPWASRVLEAVVEDQDIDGNVYQLRVKLSDVAGRKIVEGGGGDSGRPLVPHVYAGVPAWRAD